MRLEEGRFQIGKTVVVSVHGKKYKRKVRGEDGKPYIIVNGEKVFEDGISNNRGGTFDKATYDLEYVKANRSRFTVKLPKSQGTTWKRYAADLGMSMNAFIIYCVEKEIHGEN